MDTVLCSDVWVLLALLGNPYYAVMYDQYLDCFGHIIMYLYMANTWITMEAQYHAAMYGQCRDYYMGTVSCCYVSPI